MLSDVIPVAQLAEGDIYVPLRPIVEVLGLNCGGQLQRVRRDDVLREALGVCVMHTASGAQAMQRLPLKHLPGFLFGVTTTRVQPDLQATVLRYRRDTFDALWQAFKGDVLPRDRRTRG
jgi:hypothetical protein